MSWAEAISAADLPPEKVRQFLELANTPVVKSWLEGKVAAPAPTADTSIADAISNWGAAVGFLFHEVCRARVGDLAAFVLADRGSAMRFFGRGHFLHFVLWG